MKVEIQLLIFIFNNIPNDFIFLESAEGHMMMKK